MLVVLDTNVVVSALLSPGGRPAYIFKQFLDGDYTLCCDERILREYEAVLSRPKFRFRAEAVAELMRYIRASCLNVQPVPFDVEFTDEADKKFYEVAKYCNAVLITGNRKHFPDDPLIKSVHEV